MTRRARTTQDAIDQILATARLERVDWLESFLKHSQIKDAAGISEAVDAALRLYGRTKPYGSETIRTPKQVAIAGGDHEDCAAFAIALAIALGLPYELKILLFGRKSLDLALSKGDERTISLTIANVQILPRLVK